MAKAIGEIKEEFQNTTLEHLEQFIASYILDERQGVQKLVLSARKQLEKLDKERARIEKLKEFEKKYEEYEYICGIDEVGRGPFAGPVVAGAVILPKDCDILYIYAIIFISWQY